MAEEKKVFNKRVYGAVVIKSKLANYNADFTGNPRTLPDGTVYATDKVLKFKIRDYLEKSGKEIFAKTKYKENGNPMTLEEVYKHHFGEVSNDKLEVLKNLLSIIDVRLFGATFAMQSGGNNENNVNISIHGPVQISYGVNRFLDFRDSGMFTDQIGSPYASKEDASQTTLGAQTRSFEAHYVHHFSINPKNLSLFIKQILKEKIVSELTELKKTNKKEKLVKSKTVEKINQLLTHDELKQEFLEKLNEVTEEKIDEWKNFVRNNVPKDLLKIEDYENCFLQETDINLLKKSLQVAVTAYDSTSKKDVENELLLWIELNENSEAILRNFSELIEIKKVKIEEEKNTYKTEINLSNVFNYLKRYKDSIDKVEIFYDSDFTEVEGIPSDWENDSNNKKVHRYKKLGKSSNNDKEKGIDSSEDRNEK